VNLEFLAREVTVGAPSTQWWINLSTAIVFGLGFATILTLIVTPAALMAIANLSESRTRWVVHMKRWIAVPAKNHIGLISAGIAAWSGRTIRSWGNKLPRMK